jgi:hypothetical protein
VNGDVLVTEIFEVGSRFRSPYNIVCEVVAVIPEVDSNGFQSYVIKTFYEMGKFIFDIADHETLVECERF